MVVKEGKERGERRKASLFLEFLKGNCIDVGFVTRI